MSASLTNLARGISPLVELALTRRPVAVRVCPINSTTVSQVRSGLPRQFCVMWQKRRCSILFHLLVPGGNGSRECATWSRWRAPAIQPSTPVSDTPLLPPASAVMKSSFARG